MTKKDLQKFIKINFKYVGRKLHIGVSDTLKKIDPSKGKYTVTDDDIDTVSIHLERLLKTIETCKYTEHIDGVEKCIEVFEKRFPFAVIINKILERKTEKKRETLPGYYDEINLKNKIEVA